MYKGRSYFLVVAGILLVALPLLTVMATPPQRFHVLAEGGDRYGCDMDGDGFSDESLAGHFWQNYQEVIRYDEAGNIETIRAHWSGHGELTIESTGVTYTDHANANLVLSLTDMTYTESGNTRHIFNPGEDTLWHDVGRYIIDLQTGMTIFEAGHHDWSFSGLDVCGWFGLGHVVWWEPLPTTVKYLQGG